MERTGSVDVRACCAAGITLLSLAVCVLIVDETSRALGHLLTVVVYDDDDEHYSVKKVKQAQSALGCIAESMRDREEREEANVRQKKSA
ncbi:MAG: hypothetical protein JWL77_7109 [Chthonomonadaceae bacterium]|nr:hypothetical protein [Chthonomonadaceae bacterium]